MDQQIEGELLRYGLGMGTEKIRTARFGSYQQVVFLSAFSGVVLDLLQRRL